MVVELYVELNTIALEFVVPTMRLSLCEYPGYTGGITQASVYML